MATTQAILSSGLAGKMLQGILFVAVPSQNSGVGKQNQPQGNPQTAEIPGSSNAEGSGGLSRPRIPAVPDSGSENNESLIE